MVKPVNLQCCEHCGSPEEKQCYSVTSFPDTTVSSMTLCEDCLKILANQIAEILQSI